MNPKVVTTTRINGKLFLDIWQFHHFLVHEFEDIPNDGAIRKDEFFRGLREYISTLETETPEVMT